MSAALRRRRPVGIDRERWPARRWSPVGRDVAWRLLPAGNDVDFMVRAAQASPDHGFCGVSARAGW